MNLEELGAALKAERERRGLGIEDVANALKIGARQLRALEEADLASLPHVAYTRGFIRSYASFLGFSQTEIEEVLHCLAPQENIVASQAVYTPAEESHGAAIGRAFSLIVVLLVLMGGGYFLWSSGLAQKGMDMLSGTRSDTPQVAKPSGLPEEDRTPPLAAGEKKKTDETPQAAAPTSAAPAPSTPVPAARMEAPAATPAPAAQAQAAAPTPSAPTTTAAAPEKKETADDGNDVQPGQHKVIIIATEECWIHSSADKTDVRQFSLNKGDTFALTFSTRLELKLGNAGGVRIRYDGKEMPPAGTSGQVRNLVFPPQE
ncbi:RodZ domain-containing protein [uncultured Desulfovibrio sp.]|uniref:RodZ domain-containing protein n=1 Tax=uncultured Desulfovibrio sp. TaxID=167968 RepID=UPI00320B7EFC